MDDPDTGESEPLVGCFLTGGSSQTLGVIFCSSGLKHGWLDITIPAASGFWSSELSTWIVPLVAFDFRIGPSSFSALKERFMRVLLDFHGLRIRPKRIATSEIEDLFVRV
jgi:hypothetical protein